ncbi:MAG: damage-control phosphatase ARMT1 family protein [Candidatus Poribacteria bacterium]
MIAKLGCIPCILDDICGAIEALYLTDDVKKKIAKECLKFLSENIELNKEPSFYITTVHRILKRISGIDVPFSKKREICNIMGLQIEHKLDQKLADLSGFEKFSTIVKWCIAGNALDFRTVGTGYDFGIEEIENSLYELTNKLEVDHLQVIYEKAKSSQRILFVHDNVGEIAIDKLLIKSLRELNGATVISAVRGGAITSDATAEDAEKVRLADVASSVILAGPDTLGISFEEMSSDFKNELNKADMIFAKGQANYYVFSEHKDEVKSPIVCLLRTKCEYVYSAFGFSNNINIAVII